MANVTQTAFADAIKTTYERRLLTRALPRLIHGRWLERARLNKMGSYELRKYASLSAVTSALTEGTTPTELSAPTVTTVTLTPLFYGAWIGYTDELDLTNFDPVVSEISGILGEQAGLSADTIIRGVLCGTGATKDYAGSATQRSELDTTADLMTYAEFIKQLAELEVDGALPVDGQDFICIIHPYTWATLMQDDTFVNMFIADEQKSDSAMRSGYLGRVLRCKIYISSNVASYAGTGITVYDMLFIGKEAAGQVGFAGLDPAIVDNGGEMAGPMTGQAIKPVEIIAKPLGSAGADDPLNQRGTIAWKMALDVEILNQDWVRSVEHAVVI